MPDLTFSTILTTAGAEKLARLHAAGQALKLSEMAVGDGNTLSQKPGADASGLVSERHRGGLNKIRVADSSASIIESELLISAQAGGFWINEAALYDEDGDCFAVASLPPTYKPKSTQGAAKYQIVRMSIAVSSTDAVTITDNPSVVIATEEDVSRAEESAKDYTDEQLQLQAIAIQEAIIKALRDAWEEDNPPGTVRFFNQKIDPNERWPHSQWVYTGENRTIRVGSADGSNVNRNGGNDTVSIKQANLPAVQLDVSGETSEKGPQVIETTSGGRHHHGTFGEAPGVGAWPFGFYDETPQYLGSNDSDGDNGLLNSTEDGEHNHQATVPEHKHTVSGKTANLGQGQELNIVESHILLMCWARVA
ncbi:phage tail protein [Pluralibacter gergoviae]|nr:phage tail protein [Pluralibacter gergoviae]